MTGRGNAGERGGAPGDLIVVIEEQQHEELFREENDIVYNLNISFVDAALGMQTEVPTVDAKAKIKVPAGTQSGKVFRLKGKGIPNINNSYEVGDQQVRVNVWIPNSFSPNGDGVNDIFYAFGSNISEFNIQVYNRWGNIVYQSENYQSDWNGWYTEGRQVDGPLPAATYFYVIDTKKKSQDLIKGYLEIQP